MAIRAIAFDLDDTLMDTTGILVPQAARRAFQILIDAGLKLTLDQCEQKRTEMIKKLSHKEVFEKLAAEFGEKATLEALVKANSAFYEPELPEHLPLLPGALENLKYLSPKYSLYVVTAGFDKAQQEKVQALGIQSYFKKVFVVNSLNKEKKRQSFETILQLENCLPEELFCIGNSLSSEITDALALGCVACYFEFGEDRGHEEKLKSLKPHFHIKKHSELISTCRL